MILSFAWTMDVFLAGLKTCTRRRWSDVHHQRWVNAWRGGRHVHQAWDKVPFAGGRKIGDLRLVCEPYRQRLDHMPVEDLKAEGGLWDSREEFFALFGNPAEVLSVVRFELIRPGDYPTNWDEIAAGVKDAAGWRCEHCDHPHDVGSGHVLTVHHLDMNPSNCAPENLVALCQRCHLHWQARYIPGQSMMPFALPDWLARRGHG